MARRIEVEGKSVAGLKIVYSMNNREHWLMHHRHIIYKIPSPTSNVKGMMQAFADGYFRHARIWTVQVVHEPWPEDKEYIDVREAFSETNHTPRLRLYPIDKIWSPTADGAIRVYRSKHKVPDMEWRAT